MVQIGGTRVSRPSFLRCSVPMRVTFVANASGFAVFAAPEEWGESSLSLDAPKMGLHLPCLVLVLVSGAWGGHAI